MDYPIDLVKDGELAARLSTYFSSEHLETIARNSRFVERSTSRLTGQNFLMLNVFNKENGKDRSLTSQCDYLEEHFSLKMSKQGLDERYNTYAVKFMQSCYEHLTARNACSFPARNECSFFHRSYTARNECSFFHRSYTLFPKKIERWLKTSCLQLTIKLVSDEHVINNNRLAKPDQSVQSNQLFAKILEKT